MDMVIEDVQDLLAEKELGETGLVEMVFEVIDQIDSEDHSSDENSQVTNFTLKSYRKDLP